MPARCRGFCCAGRLRCGSRTDRTGRTSRDRDEDIGTSTSETSECTRTYTPQAEPTHRVVSKCLRLKLSTKTKIVLLCSRFKWQFNDFVCGNVSLNNYEFLHNFHSRVRNDDWSAAQLLEEILRIRDDDFRVLFIDGGRLSTSELNCILSYVASNRS